MKPDNQPKKKYDSLIENKPNEGLMEDKKTERQMLERVARSDVVAVAAAAVVAVAAGGAVGTVVAVAAGAVAGGGRKVAAEVRNRTYALTEGRNCGFKCSLPIINPVTNEATTSLYKAFCHW
jgi:uncharacterized protein YcfJ